jgi:hypothetical protein
LGLKADLPGDHVLDGRTIEEERTRMFRLVDPGQEIFPAHKFHRRTLK